jgi:thioredoxin
VTAGVAAAAMLAAAGCEGSRTGDAPREASGGEVRTVASTEQFERIMETAGNRLLLFDLYADWCMPCRVLSPILEEIAREHAHGVSLYKINVDQNPSLARAFGVRGIPYVVFVKDGKAVHAMTGVNAKDAYVRAIKRYGGAGDEVSGDEADGDIVDGVRVITVPSPPASGMFGEIYVYRGDTVDVVFQEAPYRRSIHIPAYDVAAEADSGEQIRVSFKAGRIGVFPLYCNGNCPAGDGAQYGRIVVMPYQGDEQARFSEISVKEAQELMADSATVILDVRTPREYFDMRIRGATLIPVAELQGRLSELREYKDARILVYCRSGNRSTVAGQILNQAGYSAVYNLSGGIRQWIKERQPIEKGA